MCTNFNSTQKLCNLINARIYTCENIPKDLKCFKNNLIKYNVFYLFIFFKYKKKIMQFFLFISKQKKKASLKANL